MPMSIHLVGYGVDTLIINVRYADSAYQPIKQELDEKLVQEWEYLQAAARHAETAVASPWSFLRCLALCRATWSRQAMALAAHVAPHQSVHLTWSVQ